MDLKQYFDTQKGTGVLSTADAKGKVNSAIFGRPHVLEGGHLGFIMTSRLTHSNLQDNPSAVYLFREDGPGWTGKRLYLRKIGESDDARLMESLRRSRCSAEEKTDSSELHLVSFATESELPLVGAG